MLIFSSYDAKGEIWSRPMFQLNEGTMLRTWSDVANDKNHPIGQHPEDHCLYQIGEWNDVKGELIPLNRPKSLGLASGYLKKNKPLCSN